MRSLLKKLFGESNKVDINKMPKVFYSLKFNKIISMEKFEVSTFEVLDEEYIILNGHNLVNDDVCIIKCYNSRFTINSKSNTNYALTYKESSNILYTKMLDRVDEINPLYVDYKDDWNALIRKFPGVNA
jgi:hypothetical protein